ncbi:hypothetical protein FOY91_05860, partial [Sphingomonas solaris]
SMPPHWETADGARDRRGRAKGRVAGTGHTSATPPATRCAPSATNRNEHVHRQGYMPPHAR